MIFSEKDSDEEEEDENYEDFETSTSVSESVPSTPASKVSQVSTVTTTSSKLSSDDVESNYSGPTATNNNMTPKDVENCAYTSKGTVLLVELRILLP